MPPFDTIMKNGYIADDTIREVDSTSSKELDSTSSCVVELHWQIEESINLLFILSICFATRNSKWVDRYTLQRYNRYFSWVTVAITMRGRSVRTLLYTENVQGEVQGRLGVGSVPALGRSAESPTLNSTSRGEIQ